MAVEFVTHSQFEKDPELQKKYGGNYANFLAAYAKEIQSTPLFKLAQVKDLATIPNSIRESIWARSKEADAKKAVSEETYELARQAEQQAVAAQDAAEAQLEKLQSEYAAGNTGSLLESNIENAEGTIIVNQVITNNNLEKPTQITPNGSATIEIFKDYSNVRFEVRNIVKPEGAEVKVWAMDTTGAIWDMLENGWGPQSGFPVQVGYRATTPFEIAANKAGEYKADIVLIDVNSNEVVETMQLTFTVRDQA